ncbi:hypothetical protein FNV43_RR17178 [Rhamnella rubrinervis]|uniref:RPW8 domain-containing protein n=1 Tax=Rhamnella rubrinervis TaxID=2594499 RepID=A0A8K0E2P9_9ROSA|nr:hypothetical protein FNV43_RR17178 [Rhamnella rubrinervis]
MAGEFIGGAAIGVAFGLLFEEVKQMKDKAKMFKSSLNDLHLTLQALEHPIIEIQQYNMVLHLPPGETTNFELEMKNGKDLLLKCNDIHRFNIGKKSRYMDKLGKLDGTLNRLIKILDVQAARDTKKNLMLTTEIFLLAIRGHKLLGFLDGSLPCPKLDPIDPRSLDDVKY